MILLLSNPRDEHIFYVLPELNRRNLSFQCIHTEDYPSGLFLESKISTWGVEHRINSLDTSEIMAVWYRRPLIAEPEMVNPLFKAYTRDEREGYTTYFFNALQNACWISPPVNIESARNKLLQLEYAKQEGFSIPDTLITTDLDSFKEFYEAHGKKVIIKSIKGHWYDRMGNKDYLFFTSLLKEDALPTEDSLKMAPCLFQGYMEKDLELRITVVGEKVFAAGIYSQEDSASQIDWRLGTGRIRHVPYDLPPEIERRLVKINERFGLKFGAYDVILTPQGEYIFLELNPNGQWVWIQEKTGLKIKESLVDLLENGTN